MKKITVSGNKIGVKEISGEYCAYNRDVLDILRYKGNTAIYRSVSETNRLKADVEFKGDRVRTLLFLNAEGIKQLTDFSECEDECREVMNKLIARLAKMNTKNKHNNYEEEIEMLKNNNESLLQIQRDTYRELVSLRHELKDLKKYRGMYINNERELQDTNQKLLKLAYDKELVEEQLQKIKEMNILELITTRKDW